MATLLPPPKRPKRHHGSGAPLSTAADTSQAHADPEDADASASVVVRFVAEADGALLAPPVSLPARATRAELELLVNRLVVKGGEEPTPYAFHVDLPHGPSDPSATSTGTSPTTVPPTSAPTRIVVTRSLAADVLAHTSRAFTREDVLVVRCAPQAVFRVRPALRCSATLSGHASPILCAAFSPTGARLATGAGDATARLWDAASETPMHVLAGHTGWVLCVAWDARGRWLASGGHDGHVRLWDPETGSAIGSAMRGHTKWVTALAWEPIHLNPASPRLASSSKDGTVRVWSTARRATEYTLGGHAASVNAVCWGGGGAGGTGVLYTASSDRTVKIWDPNRGTLLCTLKDHAHWVTTLALNTDYVLRTGPFDHTSTHPASDAEAQSLAAARYNALVATAPEMLISGSDDHTLLLWSPFPGTSSAPTPTPTPTSAPSPSALKPVARLTGHQRQVSHVAFAPDGRLAASAAWDGAVRLWDGRTGRFVGVLRGHVGAVYRVAWSRDSRMLVSASKDATVKIWDLKTFKIKVDLPGHTDEVYCVDFVADKVVSGGRDKTVKIWSH